MRLKKLKLVGFKSFVDPTSIPLPSNLIAIVGPNGCGKSNTIDAVRWVMGESSAKHLRGESMADVIFNGSSTRKPIGQASVELVFDNSDGTVGGEYAGYNEIAIKRQVSRDGTSNYYLNNTRCRRKDITGVFLGTGLGPRSYSIIEQGMISRLIEAKPEDLRSFLEEAAGISKYKERRRETENRIRHTRENLTRLEDICEELEKQLERLKRQAKAAERYKELRTEQHLLKAQLYALRWQGLKQKIEQHDKLITEHELRLEALITEQRSYDKDIELQRDQHHELNEKFNERQSCYYKIGADIARLEEAIAHQRERRQQLQNDLAQVQADMNALQQQFDDDNAEIVDLEKEIQVVEPQLQETSSRMEASQQHLSDIEAKRAQWQQQWDEFNQLAAESSKVAHVEQTRIQHMEQTLHGTQQQIERLTNEMQDQDDVAIQAELDEINEQHQHVCDQIELEKEKLESLQQQINQGRDQAREYTQQLDEQRNQLQSMRGRLASLEALQQAALGQHDDLMVEWLEQNQLANAKRLAQQLTVSNGWETAVETVLGNYLQAVCVDDIKSFAQLHNTMPDTEITFVDQQNAAMTANTAGNYLLSHVQSDFPLVTNLLAGIRTADNMADAEQLLDQLNPGESIITNDGIWLGQGWLRIAKEQDQSAGVLQREQELTSLQQAIDVAIESLQQLEQQSEAAKQQLVDSEQARDTQQQSLVELNHQQADINAKVRVKQNQLQQMRERAEQIQQELQQQQSKMADAETTLQEARQAWQQAMTQMDEHADIKRRLSDTREEISQSLEQARVQARQDRELSHELQIRLQSNKTQLASSQQNLQRMSSELERMTARRDGLQTAMQQADNPGQDLDTQLKEQLSKHLEAEQQVKEARAQVEQTENALRDFEQKRQQADQSARAVQSKLEQARIDSQAVRVRATTIEESVSETEYQLPQLIEEMPEEANEAAWDEEVERMTTRIQRLGAINLAAIDEYKTESERKEYLDKQFEDLTTALTTLENAIRKIDKETRQRFKDTYDQVNNSFKNLFPRLFGGGQAYLELTGEDLLDTGVAVMARPPGKRNSSIHQLSGGEKAMTAVALVFAIFQLNPSPFCMLDEVDAPLDDANVARFCNLVKEMSDTVQFIFITHNKVTMELANHLSGVTMKEPGVSRLVSVDVDQAVSLAEA